jgi:putative hydrolase of HD superfamily
MLLADEIKSRGVDVDIERVLKMALLHDWAEARVGDMPRTATHYFGADSRKRAERAALADILGSVGAAESQYKGLYQDYEQRRSLEARLVKAADIIDLLIQAYALERAGAKELDEFWQVVREADFQLPAVAHEVVREVLQLLLDARSRIE